MPVGYTALKTVASLESVKTGAEGGSGSGKKKKRGHAPGNRGNCCKQCSNACGRFCRLSGLTKCLILSIVLVFLATGLVWIGGASLTGPASSSLHADLLCGRGGSGGGEKADDPTVFLLRENIFAWYLANTGLIVTFTIFSSCVCCVSYVGLCCGLPRWAKICGVVGFAIVFLMFAIYTVWVGVGVYLIAHFDKVFFFTSTCRNILLFEVFLVVYLVVMVLAAVVFCVWRARDVRRREKSTPKQKHKTTPALLAV